MSLPSVGQSLLANQILSRYKPPPYWNFISDFDLDQFGVISTLFCIRLPNFAQIGAPTVEIRHHIHPFLKMATATAKYYSLFRICWCHCLQKVKVYQQTIFRQNISIRGWDISTSGFEMQTSAILEFYFRFRSRLVCRNLHDILRQPTEIRPNRSPHCGNMTSYPFLKMATATAKYYFRFRICVAAFRRSKSISKPNFVEISQLATEI